MKAETVREIVLALEHDYSRHSVERILAALTQTAEYQALVADAERYRWFRHMWLHIECIPDQIVCAESTEQFDTAIDAARGEG